MLLTVIAGPDKGRSVTLVSGVPVVIGRDADVQFVLNDPAVSRRHCSVASNGNVATVTDIKSSSGTFVNGAPVAEAALNSGDVIRVGNTSLQCVATDAPTVPPEQNPDVAAIPPPPPAGDQEDHPYSTIEPPPGTAAAGNRFRILRPLAKGGLGIVSVAVDEELHREVALKEIQERYAGNRANRGRFVLEAEITGRLEHPGIVPVYGLGTYADGRPFYAMRLIRGESLREAIAQYHVPAKRNPYGIVAASDRTVAFRKLLQRFIDVCEAMAYAHSRGVLHRDLKPDNVMLGKYGETLVVDWGLAKARGEKGDRSPDGELMITPSGSGSSETLPGTRIGTPQYMSPEQAAGRLDDLGPASDVYSLGATLYHVLTGVPPFDRDNMEAILRKVQKGDYLNPRQRLASIPKPLEAVCVKAMSLRPEERYASASALAAEIEHWLADEPVTAYRESPFAIASRWVRKHRAWAMSGAAALAIVAIVSSVAALWINSARGKVVVAQQAEAKQLQVALRNEKLAIAAKKKAEVAALAEKLAKEEEAKQRLLAITAAEDEKKQRLLAVQETKRANDEADGSRRHLYTAHMNLTQLSWHGARVSEAERLLELYRPRESQVEDSKDLRGFEWYYWDRLCRSDLVTLKGHTGEVFSVAFSPDGKKLASAGADKTVIVWDATSRKELLTFKGHTGVVSSVVFSPDGKRLASASSEFVMPGHVKGEVKVWDSATGRETLTLQARTSSLTSVVFSADGSRLASVSNESGKPGEVKVWDVTNGQETLTLKGHTGVIWGVAFSPDGKRLASASDQAVQVWDAATGQETLTLKGHNSSLTSVVFSPDGNRLASASNESGKPGEVKVWDVTNGQETLTLKGHTSAVTSVVFTGDGKRLASASNDQTVRVWDVTSGEEMLTLKGHTSWVASVAFSPDGRRLVSAGFDQTVKMWDATSSQESLTLKGHTGWVWSVAFSPDGNRLASASADQTVKVWDITSGQETLTLKGHTGPVMNVTFSPDGKRLVSASADPSVMDKPGEVKIWDATSGQETLTLKVQTNGVRSVAFSPDGKRLVSAGTNQAVKVWDATSGEETLTLKGHTGPVRSVAFSPYGNRLATAISYPANTVNVWDATSGQELLTLRGHISFPLCVAFSADGKRLVSVGAHQTMVWDATSGQETLVLKGQTNGARTVAFSPDGRRLGSARDQTVKLRDATSGQETLTLKGHTNEVWSVAFSPDGKRLASADSGMLVKVWDARPWTPELRAEREALSMIHFLRDQGKPQAEWQAAIAADQTISEPVRQRALQFAREWK